MYHTLCFVLTLYFNLEERINSLFVSFYFASITYSIPAPSILAKDEFKLLFFFASQWFTLMRRLTKKYKTSSIIIKANYNFFNASILLIYFSAGFSVLYFVNHFINEFAKFSNAQTRIEKYCSSASIIILWYWCCNEYPQRFTLGRKQMKTHALVNKKKYCFQLYYF